MLITKLFFFVNFINHWELVELLTNCATKWNSILYMFLMNKLTFRKAARKRKCIAPLALILKQLSLQLKNSKAVVFIFHLSFCDVNKINADEGKLISVVCKNSKREKENTIRPVREEIKSGRRARVRETEKSIACWMRIINQLTLTQNAWRWCVRALFFLLFIETVVSRLELILSQMRFTCVNCFDTFTISHHEKKVIPLKCVDDEPAIAITVTLHRTNRNRWNAFSKQK